jgi:hypothetical protein
MAASPSRFAAASSDSSLARAALSEVGLASPEGVEIRLLRNERDVLHLALPTDPNAEVGADELSLSAAGVVHSTASTVSTLFGTLSSWSSVDRVE